MIPLNIAWRPQAVASTSGGPEVKAQQQPRPPFVYAAYRSGAAWLLVLLLKQQRSLWQTSLLTSENAAMAFCARGRANHQSLDYPARLITTVNVLLKMIQPPLNAAQRAAPRSMVFAIDRGMILGVNID